MNWTQRLPREHLLVAGILVLTAAVYWTGLSGPFLFDDQANLSVVRAWLAGDVPLESVVFANTSWLTHRSLAMASFALSGAIHGFDPYGFKLHNLLIHLAIGLASYAWLARLLRRDKVLAPRARLVAALIATAWLLHPLHASTVLYSVQRMAQVATLICVVGLWVYTILRDRLERNGNAPGTLAMLVIAIPVFTFLAIQGKQNGALLPLLCLVIELAYYAKAQRPRSLYLFFAVTVALPAAAVLAAFAIKPDLLLSSYALYDFTPWERLISQGPVLCDYLRQIIIPHTPSMGVFTDDYPLSRGLLDPPWTLLALVALVAITFAAFAARRRAPGFLFGWAFFLAAHAVESTFLPLELYYEHRNYLPSIGLLVALASLVVLAARTLAGHGIRIGRVGAVAGTALLLMLALQTHGRARVWGDPLVLVESELKHHPESFRALGNYITLASDLQDVPRAYQVVQNAIDTSPSPTIRGRMMMLRVWLDCRHKNVADPADLRAGIETLPPRIELGTFLMFDLLTEAVRAGKCGAIKKPELAEALKRVADRATMQSNDLNLKWALRAQAALLYSEAGDWQRGAAQARQAWQPSTPAGGAWRLVEIFLVNGDVQEARKIHREALQRANNPGEARTELLKMRPLIEREEREPGWNRQRMGADARGDAGAKDGQPPGKS